PRIQAHRNRTPLRSAYRRPPRAVSRRVRWLSSRFPSPQLPPRRHLPRSLYSSRVPIPNLVVHVDRGTHVARNHPHLFAHPRWLGDLHVSMLLIHLSHRPSAIEKHAERARIDRRIARKGFRSAIDYTLTGDSRTDDSREHP